MSSERPVICFVHIERAGGTTLHAVFRNNYPLGFLSLTPWWLWSNEDGHLLTADEVRSLKRLFPYLRGFGGHTTRSYAGYEEAVGRSVQYLTFVRDPVARYVSHFNYQVHQMNKPWTIDAFLDEPRFDNYMTRRIAGSFDVDLAKRRLAEQFAFVGLTDRFDESLLLMRNELGVPGFEVRYEKQNASRDPNYRKDPRLNEPAIRERIRAQNRLDVELFEFVTREVYPRYVERFPGKLTPAVDALREANETYRFPAWRRACWQAHRHLVYRHVERLLHRRRHGSSSDAAPAGSDSAG